MNSILVLSFVLLTQIPLSSRGIARNHVDFNLVSKVQLSEDAFLTIVSTFSVQNIDCFNFFTRMNT